MQVDCELGQGQNRPRIYRRIYKVIYKRAQHNEVYVDEILKLAPQFDRHKYEKYG